MGAAIGDVLGLAAGVVGRSPADRGHHPDTGHPTGKDQQHAVYQAIASLHAEGATAMGGGIERALDVKGPPATVTTLPGVRAAPMAPQAPTGKLPPLVVLLLSDGANSHGRTEPLQAAADTKQLGVSVFTIALGTDDGTVDLPSKSGQMRGVPVPPDQATLQRIAETTGARFLAAPSSRDLKVHGARASTSCRSPETGGSRMQAGLWPGRHDALFLAVGLTSGAHRC